MAAKKIVAVTSGSSTDLGVLFGPVQRQEVVGDMVGAALAFTTDKVIVGLEIGTGTAAQGWAVWSVSGFASVTGALSRSAADKYTTITALEPAGSAKYTFSATHGGSSTQGFRDAIDAVLEGSPKRTVVDTVNRIADAVEAISSSSGQYIVFVDQNAATIEVWLGTNTPWADYITEAGETVAGTMTPDLTALPQAFE